MFVIIGIVVVFGAVLAGYLMEHGNIKVLIQPAELVIIFGAAVGTVVSTGSPCLSEKLSQPKKKNVLSLIAAPPMFAPYWFCVNSGLASPELLLKKLFAFKTLLRRYS